MLHLFFPLFLPSIGSLATTDHFTVSLVLPFLECHIFGIIQYATFLCWLLSFNNMHLSISISFRDLIAHLSLIPNDIPLNECNTVCISIQSMKNILVASIFWRLWIKLLEILVCRFLCWHMFSTLLFEYKGVCLLDHL